MGIKRERSRCFIIVRTEGLDIVYQLRTLLNK